MKQKQYLVGLATGAALALVSVVAFQLGRVRAEGVPLEEPLHYAGTLEDNGVPVNDTRTISVALWDAASDIGKVRCDTGEMPVRIERGRFRVALPAACTEQVRAQPQLWVELTVGSGPTATHFPRRKLGVVPFALEANRASYAAGELRSQISSLETRLNALGGGSMHSAVSVFKTSDQVIPEDGSDVVNFDVKRFDNLNEFDLGSDTFIPKQSGYYLATCSVMYNTPPLMAAFNALHVVAIVLNGRKAESPQLASGSWLGDSHQATVATTGVIYLDATKNPPDNLTCVAYQSFLKPSITVHASADSSELWTQSRNSFTIVRLF
jgi:hypothetical protein